MLNTIMGDILASLGGLAIGLSYVLFKRRITQVGVYDALAVKLPKYLVIMISTGWYIILASLVAEYLSENPVGRAPWIVALDAIALVILNTGLFQSLRYIRRQDASS